MSTDRWTPKDYEAYQGRRGLKIEFVDEPKRNKYSAIKTEVDGIIFDSKKESNRYVELRLRQRAGEIEGLRLKPSFDLIVNGELICKYVSDFLYFENGERIVEDVKSRATRTRAYSIKRKLMRAIYGIEIKET